MTSSDLTTNETNNEVTGSEVTKTEETPNPCAREVSVEIPAEDVAREWKKALSRYQKHARLPGFRHGKVPATLIRSKFAQEIKSEVVEHLLPAAFRAETQRQNLIPIGQPQVQDLELEEDKPLRFRASFEVLPPFEIDGYQEIRVDRAPVTMSEEDVSKAVDMLREERASYDNVDEDRALADGDFGSISFKSTGAEEGGEPVEMNDALVEIGGVNTIPAFTENLRGVKAGETRSFDVSYGEDFAEQRLAGKTLHYEVEVKGIKRKSVPELNDEWVKELGQEGMSTVEELLKRVRERMEHDRQHQAEHRAKDELLKLLTDRYPIAVPTALVENAIDQRLERGLRQLMGQGLRAEDIKRMDMSKLRDGQREGAVRDVRANVLLEKIAELEGLTVSEDEVDKEIAAAATQSRQTPQALRQQLEERNGLEGLRSQLRCDQALNWLFQRSQ